MKGIRSIVKTVRITAEEEKRFESLRGWRYRFDWTSVVLGALKDALETKELEVRNPPKLMEYLEDFEKVPDPGPDQWERAEGTQATHGSAPSEIESIAESEPTTAAPAKKPTTKKPAAKKPAAKKPAAKKPAAKKPAAKKGGAHV